MGFHQSDIIVAVRWTGRDLAMSVLKRVSGGKARNLASSRVRETGGGMFKQEMAAKSQRGRDLLRNLQWKSKIPYKSKATCDSGLK